MLERLLKLQKWGRPLINSGRTAASEVVQNETYRIEVEALYKHYFGRAVMGCKNCYADALIELCKITKTKAMSKTEKFVMQRGRVLKDTRRNDARLNLVRGNETDELALYHLYTNPNASEYFEKLPDRDELEDMIAEYAEKIEAECSAKFGASPGVASADKVLNNAKEAALAVEVEAAELLENAKNEAAKLLEATKNEAAVNLGPEKPAASKSKKNESDSILS